MPNYLFPYFGLQIFNDILAPIYNFINIKYSSKAIQIDNLINPNQVDISSKYYTELFKNSFFETQYSISITGNQTITIENKNTKIKYSIVCEPY
jgi:hypothetical protein